MFQSQAGTTVLLAGAGVSATMAVLWAIQRRTGNAAIVDPAWAALIGICAALYAATFPGAPLRRALCAALGCGWAFRLAWYLWSTRVHGSHEEDGRYRHLRKEFGEHADRSFFFFFQIQALAAVICSLPFAAIAADRRTEIGVLDLAGILLWGIAVSGESIADRQLHAFRSRRENAGATCRAGLWKYSRHPNYFCEWLHWWAYVAITAFTPGFWLALPFPFLMLVLLLSFSGIPYAEAQAVRTRGDDYLRYCDETSRFVPWFSRKT